MFAPPVAKPKARTAGQRSTLPVQGSSRTVLNRTPALQPERCANQTPSGTDGHVDRVPTNSIPQSAGWDFSRIPPSAAGDPKHNRAASARSLPGAIQAKLEVGQVGDPLEHEADRVADRVMRMTAPSPVQASRVASQSEAELNRKCAGCEEEETELHRKETTSGPAVAPPSVHDVLQSAGQPLDPQARAFMEPRFGQDFSSVRVHTDEQAAHSAKAVNALAYTSGNNIVFDAAQYNPSSSAGRRLLAHELTHVVQQGSSKAAPALQRQTPPAAPPPAADPAPPEKKGDDDDPTAWLTLQGQPFGQYTRIFTIPHPPPWMVGGQFATNWQFHAGKTGFELGILGQYGHIFSQSVSATGLKLHDPKYGTATGSGDQGAILIQPAWVFFNTGHTQVAMLGQGGFAGTASSDTGVAGKQFSALGVGQVTQDLFTIGPVKAQGVASVGAGETWSKGPQDKSYSAAPAVSVGLGFQVAWDAIGRKKIPPPPPEHVDIKIPDVEEQKKAEEAKKKADEQKKQDEDKKKDEEAKKKPDPDPNKVPDKNAKPPVPADGKVFFLKDRPLPGHADDKSVLDAGGENLSALKARVQAALAADPSLKVAIFGYASIEAPNPKYNCDLGMRRAQWLRTQLGLTATQIAGPADKSQIAGNCEDADGLVSFGGAKAADSKVEAVRKQDRYATLHFHRP
jgi:outer membrane protein OmpA-like peptidoglycan-associated protein